ncbi:1-acyl-sn-glycerol-3-phosphate acyltransferase [Lujinxingia litoralis]|uniref:1-acyl-sn-glycerol-3-phosphate acyltransferase n=1 Tax=Lujinxingia litoralis TaxID=2211119 RepID=UPI0013144A63|nr:1-acyl-sn-glycerol-3-phosphate acyltransferase [Lujinxingia litoralis]
MKPERRAGEPTEAADQEQPAETDEVLLPHDLPILEEGGLAEASEVELSEDARRERLELAAQLSRRPMSSAMLERLGRWLSFLGRLLFAHVLFERRGIDAIRDCAERGTVVYTMETHSRLDYFYFNYAFLKHELPRARFANDLIVRPWRAFWETLVNLVRRRRIPGPRKMEALILRDEATFLFLQRPRQKAEDRVTYSQPYLYRLIQTQRRQETPIFVVPLFLFWEKRPDPRRASLLDELFGTVQSPGFFRKLVNYVQTFWQTFFKFGQPMVQVSSAINLQEFLREYPGADSSDASELLRARLEEFIRQERHVILGPTASSREQVERQVLARPELVDAMREHAEHTGQDELSVRRQAQKLFAEIAADPSLLMIKIFSATLSLVWYRIYDGLEVDEEGLERVREQAKTSAIVLVPSHKSHIDYLVLSYVFYHYGLIPPHIAAGVNLSFWPLGPLFRRAGAFFIRRSFKGEDLYPVVFREYLIRVLEEQYPVEFFIEGTRSRTGKLIKPKYGMLDMMVRAFASGRLDAIKIVPISVGYEKIIEERTYRRELLGEEKQKESLAGLLKTPKFLTSKKGRLYVEFDEPIDLGDYFARFGIDRLQPEDDALDALTVRLAHRIIYDINRVTTISPTALVATVLLNNPDRDASISRARLLHELGFLLHFMTRQDPPVRLSGALREALASRQAALDALKQVHPEQHPPVSLAYDEHADLNDLERQHLESAMGRAVASVIDRALAIFEKEKQVQIHGKHHARTYTLAPQARHEIAYYRNTLVHHFVPEGLLASAIASFNSPAIALDRLMDQTLFLSRLFKYEWIYEERAEFKNVFMRTLDDFATQGWVTLSRAEEDQQVQITEPRQELDYLRRMVLTFIEAYALMFRRLPDLVEAPVERDPLIKEVIARGREELSKGQVHFEESLSKPTLLNALRLLEDWGVLVRHTTPGRRRETISYQVHADWADGQRYRTLLTRLETLLNPAHTD